MKKIKWYSKKGLLFNNLPQTNWHDFFTWFPIILTEGKNIGKLIWLKTIERRIVMWTYDDDYFYRLKTT